MIKIGVIGGTAIHGFFKGPILEHDTLYGKVKYMLTTTEPRIVYIPRHGFKQHIPSSQVNYRAIISTLLYLGVRYVVSTTLASRLNKNYEIGDIVVPHDVIDFTKSRQTSLDPTMKAYIDTHRLFSENLRETIIREARQQGFRVHPSGVVVVIEGPRGETPAEARMYRLLGGDLISMSLVPEVFMAKEAGIEYASIALIIDHAADEAPKKDYEEIKTLIQEYRQRIGELILKIASSIISS